MHLRTKSAFRVALFLVLAMATAQGQQNPETQSSPPSPKRPPTSAPESSIQQGQAARENTADPNRRSPNGQSSSDSQNASAIPQLPNAPSAPLTKHQKFTAFVKRSYSPYTFSSAALSATWAQAWGDFYSYGGGMQGWSKRFGASLANTEIRNGFNSFLFPVIFKQDPRYFPSHKDGIIPRFWYAATRTLIARRDSGGNEFNWSEVLGGLATVSIQNAYYPSVDRGFPETMQRYIGTIGSDAGSNVLREFSPDIKRILRRLIPKKAQKLEDEIPEPVKKTVGVPSLKPKPAPKQ